MILYPPYGKFTQKEGTIFLAGSIEMGVARQWQDELCKKWDSDEVEIANPRRLDWDSSWIEGHPELEKQIKWELETMFSAGTVLFYFDPNTKSPITLLELGLCLSWKKPMIVICPKGFWRRQNIITTCELFNIKVYEDLNALDITE